MKTLSIEKDFSTEQIAKLITEPSTWVNTTTKIHADLWTEMNKLGSFGLTLDSYDFSIEKCSEENDLFHMTVSVDVFESKTEMMRYADKIGLDKTILSDPRDN